MYVGESVSQSPPMGGVGSGWVVALLGVGWLGVGVGVYTFLRSGGLSPTTEGVSWNRN